jgi:5'(3')-deoxyribonucleotidase
MDKNIFLDLDGVIVDFVGPACVAHNKDPKEILDNWEIGEWNMAKMWGITNYYFYEPINNRKWWAELKFTEDALGLLSKLHDIYGDKVYEKVCILTSHGGYAEIAAGKIEWIKKNMPKFPHILTRSKHFCASAKNVLIDDNDLNYFNFKENGGECILFPRIWNGNHEHAHDGLNYTIKQLDMINE